MCDDLQASHSLSPEKLHTEVDFLPIIGRQIHLLLLNVLLFHPLLHICQNSFLHCSLSILILQMQLHALILISLLRVDVAFDFVCNSWISEEIPNDSFSIVLYKFHFFCG